MPPDSPSLRTKITGVCAPAHAYALAELVRRQPAPVWLIVQEEAQRSDSLAEDIALLHHATEPGAPLEILIFPEAQTDHREMREAFHAASDRLSVLSRLRGVRLGGRVPSPGDATERGVGAPRLPMSPLLILTTPAALLQPVPPLTEFAAREVELKPGDHHPFKDLLKLLENYDYDSEAVCEAPGQYAVRGGIVDVYPITAQQPYRLDFFGDTLEEIRALDPVTQRSGDAVAHITLTAAPQLQASAAQASLLDYLNPAAHAVFLEAKSLEELFDSLAPDDGRARTPLRADIPTAGSGVPARPFLAALPESCAHLFGVSDLDLSSELFDSAGNEETWDTESLSHHRSYPEEQLLAHERLQAEEDARRQFFARLADWKGQGYAIDFVVSKEGEEQRVRELLTEDAALKKLKPRFLRGTLNEGFRVTMREGRMGPPGAPQPIPGGPSGPALPARTVTRNPSFNVPRRNRGFNFLSAASSASSSHTRCSSPSLDTTKSIA